jgi:high affinity Mn2+ porin
MFNYGEFMIFFYFRRWLLIVLLLVLCVISIPSFAEVKRDTLNVPFWNFHFQSTLISQYHPGFQAKYTGQNSAISSSESTTSLSSTFYLGTRLWKGASAYYNFEVSGGSGFSQTRGIAGFPNGEVYRVSDPSPKYYNARYYLTQIFPLTEKSEKVEDDINQLAANMPVSYFSITVGKFSIMDFFDDNSYSHDPRTQFYNWALMGNGAWDYPADTRGYTYGVEVEMVKPAWTLRFAAVMVPTTANGADMDWNLKHSHSESVEFEQRYKLGEQSGAFRLMGFLTEARMGNYKQAIEWGIAHNSAPVIDATNHLGRTKYGFGVNAEQQINNYLGAFFRLGWNDGNNETWTFTEIDRSASAGIQLNGSSWNRIEDKLGTAFIVNGLSSNHRKYLEAGGYGFIIGDGALNYGAECITEVYYSFRLAKYCLWVSPDYQLIINPAYNKDRGPVNALGARLHVQL